MIAHLQFQTENVDGMARVIIGERVTEFAGRWVTGGPWERFGLYNHYVVVRDDGEVMKIPAHAGELVPGSTEDLDAVLRRCDPVTMRPSAPMTLELDPTYTCPSKDCGGRCFSAPYRRLAPRATVPTSLLDDLLRDFAREGGRVVRFDGGGDPLAHPAVRSGELLELANEVGLKTTILTSGDLLAQTDLLRIGRANCYLRVSLNAATNETRQRFHGNSVSLNAIFSTLERFASWLALENIKAPIGATFLLDVINCREVYECARIAREAGIAHFSVRRVLGPPSLRPEFSAAEVATVKDQFAKVRELESSRFRVFLPWRFLDEPDLNPAKGDFRVTRCWQSTFKTVIEPDPTSGGFRAQLCGRYRGSGVGQLMQMPPLFSSVEGSAWTDQWRKSFTDYGVSRDALPQTCISCIDRGFIMMIDSLLLFLKNPSNEFHILHLDSEE